MQTLCGALSYQTLISRNYKPFSTKLCVLLLTVHETQTLNACITKAGVQTISNHLKLHATQIKQITQTETHSL